MVDACIHAPAPIPVPGGGACDWGLRDAGITAYCSICAQYFDGRTTGGFVGEPCVFVPSKWRCYPKKWALNKNIEFDSCGEFDIY